MADWLASGSSSAELRRRAQLEASDEAGDLLGRLNALDFVSSVVGEATDIPDRLGVYRITGLLGRGGMGVVYRAWQEDLEREVALKVLANSYSSDPTMRERFRAEARATASLHHRHIVPIYDYGEAQGCLYFAMERVDGVSLDRHISAARRVGKRPMDPFEAARRFAGVADALGLAHRRRILHRDVKPGNILVAADGTLALTDFGLAKALDHESMRLTTKSGGFLGTLHYSSPEQALARDLSPASDLYGLGVTLFEAVSGELPVAGRTTESVLQSLLYGQPRRLREVLPRPPRDLEAVLEKLLAREPADRYQDGEALARDLNRIADGEPVHIRRLPWYVRLARRARKNPVLAGAMLAASVLLLVTSFLLVVLRKERGQSLISRHQNNLVAVTNQVKAELGWPFGPAPLLHCLCGDPEPAPEHPSGSILGELQRVDAEVGGDPIVAAMRTAYVDDPLPAASELLRLGRGYEALQQYDRAITAALAGRSFADLAAELRLYRLYLGRAVANLTASVGRLQDARLDLALASFLRPGAAFPRAMVAVLDVASAPDVAVALRQLEAELGVAAAERRSVVARLLVALAGLRRDVRANLMQVPMAYRDRRAVHDFAARWIDVEPAAAQAFGAPTGLGSQLHELAHSALINLGDAGMLREITANMAAAVRRSLHPDSPLQGWYGAVQLLARRRSQDPLVNGDDEPLSPAQELAAWDALLSLRPPRSLVELLLPRFEALRSAHPTLDGILATSARVHGYAPVDVALVHAGAWVLEAPHDSEALYCRMVARLRSGSLTGALDDAMASVQNAPDRGAALRRVVTTCEALAAEAPGATREALLAMAAVFQAVPP